jgi:hypothetical protein
MRLARSSETLNESVVTRNTVLRSTTCGKAGESRPPLSGAGWSVIICARLGSGIHLANSRPGTFIRL